MADGLRWLTMTAFPGIDNTNVDALLQPRAHAPATMRRMMGFDTLTEPGLAKPAQTYTEYAALPSGTLQGFHSHVSGDSAELYVAVSGVLYEWVNDTWEAIVSSHLPLHATNRVRFVTAYDALFIVDGADRPKVLGWNYDEADTTVVWDTQHTVAEIKYTAQPAAPSESPSDDFYADNVCFHADRLILIKDDIARSSGPYAPTTFYEADNDYLPNAWVRPNEGDGHPVTVGKSFENQMLVLSKPFSLHGYVGTDPATSYARIVLDDKVGAYAPDSISIGRGKMWFCSYDGPAVLDVKDGVDADIGRPVESYWRAMTPEQKRAIVGWWEDGKYEILLHNDVRLTYDPKIKRWNEAYSVNGMTTFVIPPTGPAYALTASDGYVWRQRIGYGIDDELPVQELVTPRMDFDSSWQEKWLRQVHFVIKAGHTDLTLEYALDMTEGWTFLEIPPGYEIGLWRDSEDPLVRRWGEQGLFWRSAAAYRVDIPHSVHCRDVRFRLRGRNVTLAHFAVGFEYKGV